MKISSSQRRKESSEKLEKIPTLRFDNKIHLTTERMLLRRPANRCSWMRWQQQQCWRCICNSCCCCCCCFLLPLLAAAWCSLRLRERFSTFCRSSKKLPPRHNVSKKARPSAGPRPRAGFAGDTVADIVIPRGSRFFLEDSSWRRLWTTGRVSSFRKSSSESPVVAILQIEYQDFCLEICFLKNLPIVQ